MKITYIGHSGFLIEWETCYWLFDYYKGEIPAMDPAKMIFVFTSHKHGDHYNPEILKLAKQYPCVEYVLSSDIKSLKKNFSELGISEEVSEKINSVKPTEEYVLQDQKNDKIILKTLKSTDCGVAFLLFYQGKTIYHAGDLNLWVWKEATKQYNNNMTAKFQKEMEQLKNIPIDVAFAPLDPRLEEWYYKGLEGLLSTTGVRYVFPMHFWDKPEIIQQFKQEQDVNKNHAIIMDINQDGQTWTMEL